MPYILSPEQKIVVNALTLNPTSSNKYFDVTTAMQAIAKGCSILVKDGKKILIHLPDSEQRNALKNLFVENGLDDLTIDISENQPMPELDVIKLRSTLKKEKDIDELIKNALCTKRAQSLHSEISTYYDAFDSNVISNASFRDFANNIIYNKANDRFNLTVSNLSDKKLEYTAAEYYRVKKDIQTAVDLYDRQYDLFDHLSLFKTELWDEINAQKITETKSKLSQFRADSTALAKDFIETSNQLIESSSKDVLKVFTQLEQKFVSHEESCIAYHVKTENEEVSREGMFSLFKKKKTSSGNKIYIDAFDDLSGLIQSISSEWYEELEAPTSEMIDYEYIINFIEQNRSKSAGYKKDITKNLEQSIQRINKINSSNTNVISLDKRLEEFILNMNASNLFNLDLEHTILSFIKQSELASQISEFIEKCYILFHSSAKYLEWKSFYNSSSEIFKVIFDELKKRSSNTWVDSFEQWYEGKIKDHVLGDKIIDAEYLNQFYTQSLNALQSETGALISSLHSSRIIGADTLKQNTKELHNSLFKKKQMPNASWKNTALMNRPFMQTFFPIHITNTISHAKEYDIVITFETKNEVHTETYHYFSPIESKDIQNLAEKKHNFLYLNEYNYEGLLKNLSSTNKLKASKKLAKYILSLNQHIKIYQLKNANIISILPPYDDIMLENELDKLSAKVIDTQGVLYDRLTESILFTDRRPILLIKDELINPELHEHVLWQMKLLKTFQEVGYEVFSINTVDQLNNNKAVFENIIRKIGGDAHAEKEIRSNSMATTAVEEKVG